MTTTEGSFISFGVEGVPYSQVRIELPANWPTDADVVPRTRGMIEQAVMFARILAEEYHAAFYAQREAEALEREEQYDARKQQMGDGAPLPDEPYAPSEPVRVAVDANGEVRFDGGRVDPTRESFACPDCGRKASPSIEKYQQWDRGQDGREYAAKWRCTNDQCPTKSLWRSKLVPLAATSGRV